MNQQPLEKFHRMLMEVTDIIVDNEDTDPRHIATVILNAGYVKEDNEKTKDSI